MHLAASQATIKTENAGPLLIKATVMMIDGSDTTHSYGNSREQLK